MKLFNWLSKKPTVTNVKITIVSKEEWAPYAQAYETILPTCVQIAGESIQKYASSQRLIKNMSSGAPKFAWIYSPYNKFSCHHMCFRHMSDVYSVIVAVHGFIASDGTINDKVVVPEFMYKRLLEESRSNNLIPCILPVSIITKAPMLDGSHLLDATTQELMTIEQKDSLDQIQMSDWEINNMGVKIVSDYLEKQGFTIVSYCDHVEIFPQLWFEKNGKRSYVLVRTVPIGKREEAYQINKKMLAQYDNYDGYYAEILTSSSSPILRDDKGDIVPLSKRYGKNDIWMWRGEGFYISFTGLQEINKAISANSYIKLIDNELYVI